MIEHSFEMDFDHFQFMVGDSKHGPFADTTTMWDKPETIGIVDDCDKIAGIPTVRYGGKLKVIVQINTDYKQYETASNKIGQFEIDLPSGQMIFWGPEAVILGNEPVVSVSPGRYDAFVYSKNTDSVTDEMDLIGSDEYFILLRKQISHL